MGSAGRCYLVEDSELRLLGVEKLGVEVRRREMLCFHLRIIDVSTHDEDFQREWKVAGNTLLNLLRLGQDVLVHCRGGLGRAGTIGARLLIELGMDPATAIKHVRAARPGAIETREQEKYVLSIGKSEN